LINLTLFYLNRNNMQIDLLNTTFLHATGNAGAATSQGLELTSSFSPLEGLTFGYNAAYTQCAFTRVIPAVQYQLTGFQLQDIPKWDMSITVNYDWALTDSWHARVSGGFRLVDQEWTSYVQSRSLGGYPTTVLPSYAVLDFNAVIAHGPLSLKLFARNLTDRRAYLYSDVILNDSNTPVQIEHFLLQPRTVGVGFDYAF
jgi:iron complex outermembrane receptor protein